MSRAKILGYSTKMQMTEDKHPGTIFRAFSIPAKPEICRFCTFGPRCYTHYGRMNMAVQRNAYEENLEMIRDGTLWERLDKELAALERKAKREDAQVYIRVHDTGDYFSTSYILAWAEVAKEHPTIIFYSYTKAVGWVKTAQEMGYIPGNLRFVFSIGSTQDLFLDEKDRVAGVFEEGRAVPPGWHDGSHDDYWAAQPEGNVFLRYHGPKTQAFTAIPEWMKEAVE